MSIALVTICHKCDRRQRECNGACACTVDGVDIIEHAKAGKCPAGKFDGPCSNCGGKHLAAACPIPPNYDPKDYANDSKGSEGCGCA